jgi:gliding motility-associated-like protein
MHKHTLTFLLLFIFTTGYTQYFSTQGTAQLTNNNPVTYRITPNSNATSGLITNYFPLDLSTSFELNFDMNFGSLDGNGADGMTFFLSNLCSPGLTSGGGLGLPAVNDLLVVEFDTYDNGTSFGDIPQDHIGIYKSGFTTLSNLIIQGQTAPVCMLNNCGNVEDNTFIPIKIKWIYTSATQQKLEVYVNDVLRATSTTANHIANIFLGNNNVFWSISGSTGGLSNLQQVRFPSISSSIEDCIGSVVPLSAPLLGSNYVWSNNSSTTNIANYTISSNESVNCSYTDFCGQTKSIGFNLLPHIIPTPTVEITNPNCGTNNGKIKILSPLNSSSLPIPTDLFISEVSDHDPGSLTYIEIYNGTGVSKNLANYKIKVYNNGNTFTSCDFPLSGILLNNDVYVIAIGSTTNEGGVIPDLVVSTCSGVNTNDNIRLTSNTNIEIDLWGRTDGNDFTPNNANGYVYRRLVTAPHPSLTWNASDWNAIDPQDYSNIGSYLYQTNAYEYSINGTNYQSNVLFTGLPAGNYSVTAHDLISGCYSSILNAQLTIIQPTQPTPINCWDNFVFNTTTCTWVNNGSQPAQPTPINCWDNFIFNTTTCTWVNNGSQPAQPTPINCWDNFVFNTTTCTWVNNGSQPAQPTPINCWDNFVFNTTTCTWVNNGSQPAQPTPINCWDNFIFNTTTCVWNNTGTQPVPPTISTTAPTCITIATATITNYITTNTYIFNPSGPTVNAAGSISGMTFGTNYTVTSGIGSCISLPSASFSINTITPILPIFAQVAPICSGAALSALPSTSSNTINGNWSPALNNTATTTYTFTPDAGQCATTTTMTITVDNPSILHITKDDPNCNPSQLSWGSLNTISPTVATTTLGTNAITISKPSGGLFSTSSVFNGGLFPAQFNLPINSPALANFEAGLFTFCFDTPVVNPQIAIASIGQSGLPVPINTSVPYQVLWSGPGMSFINNQSLIGEEGFCIIVFPGTHQCISFDYLTAENWCNIVFGSQDNNCQIDPICIGESVTLAAHGSTNITWSPTTNLTFLPNNKVIAAPTQTTTYTITSNDACQSQASITVIVLPNNTITPASSNSNLCIGTALTNITYSTTGATGIATTTTNHGLPTGVSATFASNTITISGTPTVSGIFNYSIPLTGGCGNINATGTITVTANNTVAPASSSPTLCIGTTLTNITHSTTGATGIATSSTNHGLPIGVSATFASNTITISGTPTVSGIFNYSIPLTGGCDSINAIGTITVVNGILPRFTQVTPVCQGATINIPTSSNNTPPIVGVWNLISSTANDVTYEFTPNAGQCGLNTTMTIVVHPLPTVIPSVTTQSFCSGGTTNINLVPDVAGSVFYWTATGTTVTGQSGSVIGSGATSINQTLTLNANQVAAGQVTYSIVAEANGCLGAPVTVVVTVNPIPNVIVSPVSLTETICSGGTTNISFSGAINNTVYSWSVVSSVGVSGALNGSGTAINQTLTTTGLSQGTVVYEVTPSLNGCTGTPQRITVTVNPVPEIFGSASHPDLCSGESTFISVSTFNATTVFNWTVDPVGVSGASAGTATGSSINIAQALTTTGNTRGYVDYIITPVLTGCSGIPITVRVYVNPLPVVSLTDGTICVDGAGVPFQTYVLDSGLNDVDYDFVWTFDDGTIPAAIIPGANSATYTATAVGTYTVVATNSTTNCVSNIASAAVTATNPATSLTVTQSEYFSKNAILTVNVTGGNGTLMYQLDQGALQESNVFTGVSAGLHTITVVDTQGCTYLTQEVLVIDYPKYFTPNGDGHNDTWNIIGLNQPEAKLYIFDRYGKLVKQIVPSILSNGWDGTYNNIPMPSTDYWFTLDYTENGTQKQFKAHFSLKR